MRDDKVLLVKGIEGLGNRMQCALTGILYARLTGRRLFVDWCDYFYSDDGANAFPRLFQCASSEEIEHLPRIGSVRPEIWRGCLGESAWEMRKRYGNGHQLSVDTTRVEYEEDILVMWSYSDRIEQLRRHFEPGLQAFSGLSRKEILRKLLKEDLHPHPAIRQRVDAYKSRWFQPPTVGVHIRFTDFRSPLRNTLKRLNALLKRHRQLQIFVATDSLQIKTLFEETYRNVIMHPHWYPPTPGVAIHYNENRPDAMQSGIDALVDLYLLAECDYLLADTRSTFAYLAAILAGARGAEVVDVARGRRFDPASPPLGERLMRKLGLASWEFTLCSSLSKYRKFLRADDR